MYIPETITELTFISFVATFIAGFAAFLSPCVLPLLPGYLSYVSGVSVDQLGTQTRKVAIASLAFVIGFLIFFTLQGAAAGLAGSELGAFLSSRILKVIAGIFLIAFGFFILGEALRERSKKEKVYLLVLVAALEVVFIIFQSSPFDLQSVVALIAIGAFELGIFTLGMFPVAFVQQEKRLRLMKKPASLVSVMLAGMLFSIGIGPCTGPLLGTSLTLAASTQDPVAGASLLFFYALGMGLPFVVSGVLFTKLIGTFSFMKRHFDAIKIASGAILVIFGLLLASGELDVISGWLLQRVPDWAPSL
ncbi:MAG: cytochrome c biogenesis protein CcdA [Thermoleophilia bacterium]